MPLAERVSEHSATVVVAVIPALNEAASIARVVHGVRGVAVLQRVIVVDNGSDDGTGALAAGAGAEVVREERRGYGAACAAGVRAAEGGTSCCC